MSTIIEQVYTFKIKGHGPASPLAAVIEDFPSGSDRKMGRAWSGYAEIILKDISRGRQDDLYKTILVKDPIIADQLIEKEKETDKLPLDDLYKTPYVATFLEEMHACDAKVLIPCGEYAFRALTGLKGLHKYRGSILKPAHKFLLDRRVVPSFGAQILNRQPKYNYICRLDFDKIDLASTGVYPEESLNIWTAWSDNQFQQFIARHYKPDGFLIFDFETLFGIPRCIGFSFDGKEACTVPLLDRRTPITEKAAIWISVIKLLASPIAKGNQNINYDIRIANRFLMSLVKNVVWDTQLGAGTILAEFPRNLGFLTSINTTLPYHKDEGHTTGGDIQKLYDYCGKDCITTWLVKAEQEKFFNTELKGYSNEPLSTGKEPFTKMVQLLPIYRDLENRGLRVSEFERTLLFNKYTSLYNILYKQIQRTIGNYNFNPRSPKQKQDLIFGELGYEKGRGIEGSDEKSLLQLISKGKHASPSGETLLKLFISIGKVQKVLEILNLPLYPDGRFRCVFNLVGTNTFRSSASSTIDSHFFINEKGKPDQVDLGHSLQTIGKHGFAINGKTYGTDMRKMFIPSPGYVFVESDGSGAEARVDRVLTGNYDMSIFSVPGIHRYTGSLIYNCPSEEIKKNILVDGVDRYHTSKTVRHAAERGVAGGTLGEELLISKHDADNLLLKLHGAEPFIRGVFHKSVIDALQESRRIETPNGTFRTFYGRIDSSAHREAISFYPQNIVALMTKFSMIATKEQAPWGYFLTEQHDGLLAEVPIGRGEEWLELHRKNVEIPIDFRKGTLKHDYQLIIPQEGSIGVNWAEMKDLK